MNTIRLTSTRSVNRLRKGSTLISIIVVMLIVGVMGVSIISLTRSSEQSYLSANANARAYYLAESGLRDAQQIHSEAGWRHGRERTLRLDGGDHIEVIRLANTFWATAFVDEGTAKEARARVPMPVSLYGEVVPPPTLGEFALLGNVGLSLGNNTIIRGDVLITGENVDIKGDIIGDVIAQDIDFTGQGTVNGDVFALGYVDIKTGNVTGDIHAAYGITLGSAQATVFDGWLFSDNSIVLKGKATVHGHVHTCGGDIFLSGSSSIGTAADPVEVRASGNINLSGSAKIYGDVYAGGSIVASEGAIVGNAYAGGTISSGANTGAAAPNSPTYVKPPVCPNLSNISDLGLPEATVFTAGGNNVNVSNNSTILPPGIYGHLSTPNNASGSSLTLSAGTTDHGHYYFDRFDVGKSFTLRLDLSGTHDIRIFVEQDIVIGRELNVLISTDGSTYTAMDDPSLDSSLASRVYWETYQDFDLGSSCIWFGTVFTPEGYLSVGNDGYLVGSFISGGGHNIRSTTVIHVPPNYFNNE